MKKIVLGLMISLMLASVVIYLLNKPIVESSVVIRNDLELKFSISPNRLAYSNEYEKYVWIRNTSSNIESEKVEFIADDMDMSFYVFEKKTNLYVIVMDGYNYTRVIDAEKLEIVGDEFEFKFSLDDATRNGRFGIQKKRYIVNHDGEINEIDGVD